MKNINLENAVEIMMNENNLYTKDLCEDACAFLYRELKEKNLAYICKNCCKGDLNLAEDAFQDAIIRLFSSIKNGEIRNTKVISSWIKTTARRYVIRYTHYEEKKEISKEVFDNRYESFEEVDIFDIPLEDEYLYNNPERSYYACLAAEQIKKVLNIAISNDNQRKAFILSEIYEYKDKEIAELLNMNLNTVKSNLRYARDSVKEFKEATNYSPYDFVYTK